MNFLPVLAYQKIGRAPKNSRLKSEWASPRQLEKTLTWLVRRGYTFITPAETARQGYNVHGLPAWIVEGFDVARTIFMHVSH